MVNRFKILFLAGLLLGGCLVMAQQVAKPGAAVYHTHIPLAAVPTSPTSILLPSYGPLAGTTPPAGVTVYGAYFVNTNASTQITVTATCVTGGTVFIQALINGVSSQNNHVAISFPDGLYCAGGVSWSASGTGVNGTMSEGH